VNRIQISVGLYYVVKVKQMDGAWEISKLLTAIEIFLEMFALR